VPQQGGQGLILAEHREVLAAVPAARPERDETLDELRGRQAALALLGRNLGLNRLSHAELAEQLDHERDSRSSGDEHGIDRVIFFLAGEGGRSSGRTTRRNRKKSTQMDAGFFMEQVGALKCGQLPEAHKLSWRNEWTLHFRLGSSGSWPALPSCLLSSPSPVL
jgi:hypothetical protein